MRTKLSPVVKKLWKSLRDPANRAALQLLGGLVAAVAVASWSVFVFFHSDDEPASDETLAVAESPFAVIGDGQISFGDNIRIRIGSTPLQLKKLVEAVNERSGADGGTARELTRVAGELGVTQAALEHFFRILGDENVPVEDLDEKLRDLAKRHLLLLRRLEEAPPTQSAEIADSRERARNAVENGDYDGAEALLADAETRALHFARTPQLAADAQYLTAAEMRAERGELAYARFAYKEATRHFAGAARLVPASAPRYRVTCLVNAGVSATSGADFPLAERFLKRALRLEKRTLGTQQGSTLNDLAALHSAQGRYQDAEPLYERSLEIKEKSLGPDDPEVAMTLNNIAALYYARGHYEDAERLQKRALEIKENALGPDDPEVAKTLNDLAVLSKARGKYDDAERLYKRSLTVSEKALGPEHPDVAMMQSNLAALYVVRGRYADAEPLLKRSLAISEKRLGPDHTNVGTMLGNLAALYKEQRRYAEAEPLFKRCLEIKERALGPDHNEVATTLNNLAVVYHEQGRRAEAEALFKRALEIREKALGPNHPDVGMQLNSPTRLRLRPTSCMRLC